MAPIPMFSPPLHRQRHQFVVDFVQKYKPRKVVDLGCSECTLLERLRFHRGIELLVGVDIDGDKVKKKMQDLAPISTDYLQPADEPLCIELYNGSVTQKDARLRGFDLVTSIELIEHLTLPDVESFSEVLFGYMSPVAVIVSTPNSDYNPLLPGLTGFRHNDHKFEWTRAEFSSWALKVCALYGYKVDFSGVGDAPAGQQDTVGFCSQIGVFHRLGGRDDCNRPCGDEAQGVFSYTLLKSINYPSLRDNNTLRRVLVSEVLYWAETMKRRWVEQKTDTLDRTEEGGGACFTASHLRTETEDKQTAAEIKWCSRCSSDHREAEDEGVNWTNSQGREEFCNLARCVSVNLAVLWMCCPRISALSGSLSNLRRILTDDTEVHLSQDGSAVLLYDQEQEEEDHDLEDSECAEASQLFYNAEQEEDWEEKV